MPDHVQGHGQVPAAVPGSWDKWRLAVGKIYLKKLFISLRNYLFPVVFYHSGLFQLFVGFSEK
jgi:hypothetical protein